MIEDDFMKVLRAATTLRIIPAEDNGPRPTKHYATFRMTPARPQPVHRGVLLGDKRVNSSHRPVLIQVQVYGPNSWELAENLSVDLLSDANIDLAAETYNISWNGQPRMQNVPALVDDRTYESRTILELEATYTAERDETLFTIETVQGQTSTPNGPTIDFEASIAE